MKKVIFQTLGCKVNQYESQGMREKLAGAGFAETQEAREADLLVLNSCTVTSESDRQSRYLIRRMHRLNPRAKIIVTGCYAEKNRDEILRLEGVTSVLGQNEKDRILERTLQCFDIHASDFSLCRGQEETESGARKRFSDFSISAFQGHARAFIKIQDGCNHACSFCKVVIVRGRSRSRDVASILDEVRRLARAGFREVVLTGIQLGAYGLDHDPSSRLSELVRLLLDIPELNRLRLSSIEPTDVSDELMRQMSASPKFCPHLHIPLQSGDDKVLGRMRRRYDRNFYRDLILKLKSGIPEFALTCDVMCGFPGESDEEFENTLSLLEELKPLKIHAFPYSRREGTLSARFLDAVDPQTVDERMKILRQRGSEWQKQFLMEAIGSTQPVLVEENRGAFYRGRTPNYMLVEFESRSPLLGEIVSVKLERVMEDRIWGTIGKEGTHE